MRTPTTTVAVLAATAVGVGGLAESQAFIALTTSRQTAAPDGRPRGEHHHRRRRCLSTSPLPPCAVRQEEEDGGDTRDEDDQQIFWDAVVEVSCMRPCQRSAQCSCCCVVLCFAAQSGFAANEVLHDGLRDTLHMSYIPPNEESVLSRVMKATPRGYVRVRRPNRHDSMHQCGRRYSAQSRSFCDPPSPLLLPPLPTQRNLLLLLLVNMNHTSRDNS